MISRGLNVCWSLTACVKENLRVADPHNRYAIVPRPAGHER